MARGSLLGAAAHVCRQACACSAHLPRGITVILMGCSSRLLRIYWEATEIMTEPQAAPQEAQPQQPAPEAAAADVEQLAVQLSSAQLNELLAKNEAE